jgi:peptide/nickel transport system permease protein
MMRLGGVIQEVARRLMRRRTAVAGLVIVTFFLLVGLLAPLIAPHDPLEVNPAKRLSPPTRDHPWGQDELGRDILSRIIHGARISLIIGLVSVGVGFVIGVPWGIVSGYKGGLLDLLTQRVIDALLSFPTILLAILVVTVIGPGLWNTMLAVGLASVPNYTRVVRGLVLSLREEDYVIAARAVGASDVRVLFRHIMPNALAPVVVLSTLYIATAILAAAGLGFLGLGAQPPTPEWGAMLSRGRAFLRVAPHVAAFPGLAIFLSVLGYNLLGDGLRDALDPRLRGQV